MRPLDEQTILITGSTDGLGRHVADALAQRGASVLVHGRDPDKVERVRAEIGGARGYVADLASLAEVEGLAADVERGEERLDALVNNAGIMELERRESADGHELDFAVNHLSHFLLTQRLLPLLERSAPARIVNVASIGQLPIDFGDVMLEDGFERYRAYAQSKLAQVMFTFDLAARLDGTGVTVNALHPATLMNTKLVIDAGGTVQSDVSEGVRTTLRLIADPELDGVSGEFFDGSQEAAANPQAYDADARRRVWELSERLCAGSSTG
jgi:NAD(P)-dependent dehydrogenase (short-subunit alcohol dehydrogenase family)